MLRHRAVPEARDLRKHEPHPVVGLAPAAQLGQRAFVGAARVLRGDEAGELVWVVRHDAPVRMLPPSRRRRSWVHYGVMMPGLPEPRRFFLPKRARIGPRSWVRSGRNPARRSPAS